MTCVNDVRRAEAADIPEIVRLKALLMEDGWPFDITLDEEWRERCTRVAADLIGQPHYACFVIDQDGAAGPGSALASCVSVSVEQHLPGPEGSGRSAYIGDMCTEPSYRGRGYGTRLLDEAMEWARGAGAGWASLFSTESGRAVYVKAGFAPEGPFEHLSIGLD